MRNVTVLIINRKEGEKRSETVSIEFDTVSNFMIKTDEAIDNSGFRKVELEFETDVFTAEEIEILRANVFLW